MRGESSGQTSIEFLLIVAGVVLLAIIVGYAVISSSKGIYEEINSVDTSIFDR
ncbi:TPA: class III signal peptide-containing protein [Candidatus Micrarchaeota archaeon]|nr:class III signal peptide-containing protein [Candidatus Micrarchaeota archaeon]